LSAAKIDLEGRVVPGAAWNANVEHWLPSESDRAFVASLMGCVVEPGKFANWIAPPPRGINNLPIDYEYIRFN
jgi:benzoyl-CoA 2,3-dioxygenase component B